MSKGNKTLLIIAALVVLVVGGYKWRYPTYAWHQKLTIEVDTPQGVVTGSAVVSVQVSFGAFGVGDVSGATSNWSGEATIVDLGIDRHLFMLLGHPVSLAQNTFRKAVLGNANARFPSMKSFYPKMLHLNQPSTIPSKYYPLLVTFTDINDPKTVKRVDPNDLDAAFGCGNGQFSAPQPKTRAKGEAQSAPAQARALARNSREREETAISPPPDGAKASEERAAQRPSGADVPASGVSENNFPSVAGQASATSGSASPRTGGGADAPAKTQKCYKLKSITLEITNEPVTRGQLAAVIPCVKAGKGCNWYDLGLPYSDPLSHLNGAFIRKSR